MLSVPESLCLSQELVADLRVCPGRWYAKVHLGFRVYIGASCSLHVWDLILSSPLPRTSAPFRAGVAPSS